MIGKVSGVFSGTKGKVNANVCPNCCEISIFIDELEKVK